MQLKLFDISYSHGSGVNLWFSRRDILTGDRDVFLLFWLRNVAWKKKKDPVDLCCSFRWDRDYGGRVAEEVPSFSHDFEMQIFTGKGILSSWECRNPIIVSTFFSGLVELIEKTGGGGAGEMRRWIRYLCSWVSVINVGRILNFSLFLEYFFCLKLVWRTELIRKKHRASFANWCRIKSLHNDDLHD